MDTQDYTTEHRKGQHLLAEERHEIEVRRKDGWSIYRIAKHLNRPYNTIKNEIARGTVLNYVPKVWNFGKNSVTGKRIRYWAANTKTSLVPRYTGGTKDPQGHLDQGSRPYCGFGSGCNSKCSCLLWKYGSGCIQNCNLRQRI